MRKVQKLVNALLKLDPNMMYLYLDETGKEFERLEIKNPKIAFKYTDGTVLFCFYNYFGHTWMNDFIPFSTEYIPSFSIDKDVVFFEKDVEMFCQVCDILIDSNFYVLSQEYKDIIVKTYIENITISNYTREIDYFQEKLRLTVAEHYEYCRQNNLKGESTYEFCFSDRAEPITIKIEKK